MISLCSILISVGISILGIGIISLFIWRVLSEIDKKLQLQKRDILLMFMTTIPCILFLNQKYGCSLLFFTYTYLTFYLCLTAYIDKKTRDVYCILNYISMIIGGIVFIYRYLHSPEREIMLFSLIMTLIFLFLAKLLYLYGNGDGEIFLTTSIFILAGDSSTDAIVHIYMLYFIAVVIITLSHLKEIDWKKKRFKQSLPFAPSIFAASMIILAAI